MNDSEKPSMAVSVDTRVEPNTYIVWNPLTSSEIVWLQQQSKLVAEAFQRSKSARSFKPVKQIGFSQTDKA